MMKQGMQWLMVRALVQDYDQIQNINYAPIQYIQWCRWIDIFTPKNIEIRIFFVFKQYSESNLPGGRN